MSDSSVAMILGSLFLAGLAGSLHCMGMCGPIVVGFSNAFERVRLTATGRTIDSPPIRRFWPTLDMTFYHVGRIWTYSMLGLAAGWLGQWVSAELNPLAQAGRAANFSLLVAVASGVLMLIWYAPSLAQAYPSMAALEQGSLGAVVRALHRYSSDLVMLLLFAHAFRVFVARKFAGARWLAWVSGRASWGERV